MFFTQALLWYGGVAVLAGVSMTFFGLKIAADLGQEIAAKAAD